MGSLIGDHSGRPFDSSQVSVARPKNSAEAFYKAKALIHLEPLMERSRGSSQIRIGLLDGTVDADHPAFEGRLIQTLNLETASDHQAEYHGPSRHGTLIAGLLVANRGTPAPSICPDCTLVVRQILGNPRPLGDADSPLESTPDELAKAIFQAVDAGARILNLSVAASPPSLQVHPALEDAYGYAQRRGAIVVTAAGNSSTCGYLSHIQHPWVIPVAACDRGGVPTPTTNLGPTIGTRGVLAPGSALTSTSPGGGFAPTSGTSVATAIVTGVIALLWSLNPEASAEAVRYSVAGKCNRRRPSVIPRLLDVCATWRSLQSMLNPTAIF